MRYLDLESITSAPEPLALRYATACGATWDEVGLPVAALRPGDVVLIGPWRDRSWLPSWVQVEVIPDGQLDETPLKRTNDVLACVLRDFGLSVGLRNKAPGARSKDRARYLDAVAVAATIDEALPRGVVVDSGGLGGSNAPFEVVTEHDRALEILASLHGRPFGFDFETDSLNPAAVVRWGLSLADDKMAYWLTDIVAPSVLPQIVGLVRTSTDLRASNVKYDAQVLYHLTKGTELEIWPTDWLPWDTQVTDWLLDPNAFNHGLKYLTKRKLGRDVLELDDVGGPLAFWEQPYEVQALYAAAGDARNSYDLIEYDIPRLKEARLYDLYVEVEQKITPVIAEMEIAGMHLDRRVVWEVANEFEQFMQDILRELKDLGFPGNPNADEHIARYLYQECGLPVLVKTAKTGRGSVAMDVLRSLYLMRESNPAVRAHQRELALFMEWSEVEKAMNTFIVPPLRVRGMEYLYAQIKQTRAITGRLASEPNIQNWPAHGRRSRLREMVTPPPGMAMGLGDYSQIEPRLGAHFSGDAKLVGDFRSGVDVYASLGCTMGFPEEELTKHAPRRQNMKIVFLAWLYETSPMKIQEIALRQGTWLPLAEATMYHKGITAALPRYVSWRDETVREAERTRMVREPLGGRRRFVYGLQAVDPAVRAAARREVVNYPNQAGAGYMIKGAMPAVQKLCRQAGGSLWNQIHDELDWYVGEMTESQKQEFEHEVTRAMLWREIAVPLEVEYGWGSNWSLCK